MSIFDVVDLQMTHRKARTFAMGEPPPPLFDGKLGREGTNLGALEALCPGETRVDVAAARGADGDGAHWGLVVAIDVLWFVWVVCVCLPMLSSLHTTVHAHEDQVEDEGIPFECGLSYLSLFLVFPCLCVDMFCKCVVYARKHQAAVALYAISSFGLAVAIQHHCLVPRTQETLATFFVFCASFLSGIGAHALLLAPGVAHDTWRRVCAWLYAVAAALVAVGVICGITAAANGDRHPQKRLLVLKDAPVVAGVCLYALTTHATLGPLKRVCTQLQA
jgi:hypothetical protein